MYKAVFWKETDFYGLDMTCLEQAAIKQKLQQPVCDTIGLAQCLAAPTKREFNFELCQLDELMTIDWHFEH